MPPTTPEPRKVRFPKSSSQGPKRRWKMEKMRANFTSNAKHAIIDFNQVLKSNLKYKLVFKACFITHQVNFSIPGKQTWLNVAIKHIPSHPTSAANGRNLKMLPGPQHCPLEKMTVKLVMELKVLSPDRVTGKLRLP